MAKSAKGNAFDKTLFLRVLGYAKPYRAMLGWVFLLILILSVLGPLRPILVKNIIDHNIITPNAQGILIGALWLIALLLAETFFSFLYGYYASWVGQNVIKDIRSNVYRHINSLRLKYFDNTPIGTLVTRTISDIETIGDIFSEGLLVIIADILKLAVIIGWMFFDSWQLALISLSTVPFLIIITRWFQKAVRKSFQEVRNEVANLNTFVQEHIQGMNIVQVFSREQAEYQKFNTINARHRDANNRGVWYYSLFFPAVEILSSISRGLLIWLGAYLVFDYSITPGELVGYMMFIDLLFRPMRELADKFNILQMGIVGSERVFKVLDTDEVIIQTEGQNPSTFKGKIDFTNVWFAYNDEDWVLRNVSFTADAGQSIALVGATGAGKSSVISLLNRSYEYNQGSITIDDTNIRQYATLALNRNIATVLQDVFLFSDTIANNISMGNPHITQPQIEAAAQLIGAHDFITRLPGGYQYNVMERGTMLSVGQRQLIAFIRAYVHNPSILILDEATSSIDTESETLIQQAIVKLTQNRTSIIVAHRLATILNADKILVFDQGQIIEQGTHRELLAQNGHYKKLYELQFKNVVA